VGAGVHYDETVEEGGAGAVDLLPVVVVMDSVDEGAGAVLVAGMRQLEFAAELTVDIKSVAAVE